MSAPVELLLLGRGSDPAAERGVDCLGALPPPSDPTLVTRARAARDALGDSAFVLGHHYQRDEVIAFADATGDSFRLSQRAAARPAARYVVFCGVHFMAESADILTSDEQVVILPDLAAGCSMADMAGIGEVEDCWDALADLQVAHRTVPVTYMNSSAAIKDFTGRHGGTVCTSSNSGAAMRWALSRGEKVLFLPDEHLGRNTAVRDLGLTRADCAVWDPRRPQGGLTDAEVAGATVLLWRGHCSVHGRFTPQAIADVRRRLPGVCVVVHPECRYEVVERADVVGSTERIIATVQAGAPGSVFAIGTELNLVQRLARAHPDKTVVFLDRTVCYCSTMNRIDLPHLVASLEGLAAGQVRNRIQVSPEVATGARAALEQMLALP